MSLLDQASLIVTPNGYKGGVTTGTLYSVKPTNASGDMVVSRATSATRVNSSNLIESVAINVPRLDYTGGSCPSILVEPARTNLVLYSEEFENAYYARASTTITSNNTTAPDGTITADRLVLTGTNSTSRAISRNVPITTVTTTVTFSTFVKYIDKQYLQLTFGSGFSTNFANFDLINGTVVGGTYGNAKIENYGSGWYRISITSTGISTLTCTAFIWVINSAGALRAADSTSTGTSAYWIWGAQLEDGSNATSYIPTTTATVSRNADVISKTGITNLIGQTEGTIYAEIKVTKLLGAASRYVFHLSDGTANNRIYIAFSGADSNVLRARIFSGGTLQCSINSSALTSTGTYKLAMAYKNNDIVFYVNGIQIGTDTSATIPTCSKVDLGHNQGGASQFNDGINNATVFQTRLTNAQLATLTTL